MFNVKIMSNPVILVFNRDYFRRKSDVFFITVYVSLMKLSDE